MGKRGKRKIRDWKRDEWDGMGKEDEGGRVIRNMREWGRDGRKGMNE